eukprot:8490868-Pyramimonas_sp.AAC.1
MLLAKTRSTTCINVRVASWLSGSGASARFLALPVSLPFRSCACARVPRSPFASHVPASSRSGRPARHWRQASEARSPSVPLGPRNLLKTSKALAPGVRGS